MAHAASPQPLRSPQGAVLDQEAGAIYGYYMPVIKTTVYLSAGDYRRLKALARARRRRTAALVREAVAEYARRHAPRQRARSVGAGRSGRGDVSARAEELLRGMGRRP